jgi:hypothetical protein
VQVTEVVEMAVAEEVLATPAPAAVVEKVAAEPTIAPAPAEVLATPAPAVETVAAEPTLAPAPTAARSSLATMEAEWRAATAAPAGAGEVQAPGIGGAEVTLDVSQEAPLATNLPPAPKVMPTATAVPAASEEAALAMSAPPPGPTSPALDAASTMTEVYAVTAGGEPPLAEITAPAEPTAVAEVPALLQLHARDDQAEQTRTIPGTDIPWLRVIELALVVVFFLLVTVTLIAMARRRRVG